MRKPCEDCGEIISSDRRWRPVKFCKHCSDIRRRGILPKNLALLNSNKLGAGNPMFGKKRSDETRLKSSKSLKEFYKNNTSIRKGSWTGKKNPRWKGGITEKQKAIRNSKEFVTWRLAVYTRDDYICRKCYTRGGKLHAHHIMSFADNEDLRFIVDNGITLCQPCHTLFHKKYGKSKNNHVQLSEFLSII